jgi:organic hydroperoxide reductase OsmC/OhrA
MTVTARQPGLRPETIRTRLARFMPSRTAGGWSVTWTGHTEHREELNDEDEVRASEHVGCYGAALAHTLGQAGAAPNRLRVAVERTNGTDGETPTLIVEIRAQIPGMDQAVFESVARRAQSACPVWASLATELEMRLVAVLEDESVAPVPTEHTSDAKRDNKAQMAAASTNATKPAQAPSKAESAPRLPKPAFAARAIAPSRPSWLSPKMGLAAVGMVILALRVGLMMMGS